MQYWNEWLIPLLYNIEMIFFVCTKKLKNVNVQYFKVSMASKVSILLSIWTVGGSRWKESGG